jgi:5-methyltetrahydrofolate--homocysteine methyltransferase
MPKIIDGKTVFDLSPEDFAAQMKEAAEIGGTIFGGCCGTTPAHIEKMIFKIKNFCAPKKKFATPGISTRISSFAQTVTLGGDLKIIGERINPTGKPKLKNALRENDFDFIRSEALTQVSQGAKLLDVNVGLPGIDEVKMLREAVAAVQSVTSAPLVIDTSDIKAAEAALRIYNGKPLLNSVNGKKESLESVLPLAKKYGAAVVALALDDDGIPEDAYGRIKIAQKIIDTAATYGIPKHDIVVDALTMTLSTNVLNAHITLIAVEELYNAGISTVLGVSNISFGLPARAQLNAGFLALAVERGLSAAIANPANEAMMSVFHVQKVLSGRDKDCAAYVNYFSQNEIAAPDAIKKTRTLCEAVIDGLENEARKATQTLLENKNIFAAASKKRGICNRRVRGHSRTHGKQGRKIRKTRKNRSRHRKRRHSRHRKKHRQDPLGKLQFRSLRPRKKRRAATNSRHRSKRKRTPRGSQRTDDHHRRKHGRNNRTPSQTRPHLQNNGRRRSPHRNTRENNRRRLLLPRRTGRSSLRRGKFVKTSNQTHSVST